MRRIATVFLILLFSSAIFAATIPAPGIRDTEIWVRHPGLLASIKTKERFSVKTGFGSSISGLGFLVDPAGSLQVAADYLQSSIYRSDDKFLVDNYDNIASVFNFDNGFPSEGSTAEETAYFIREYFKDGGRFDTVLDDGNRAWAVANSLRAGLIDFPPTLIRSGLTMDLAMDGGEVKDGFGWNWNADFFFDGAPSLLPQMSSSGYIYGNEFGLSFGADFGHGKYIYEDSIAVGFSVSPQVYFRSSFTNSDYITGRLSDDPLILLGSNIFYLGIGLDINLGFIFTLNDNLSLSFDMKHIPSMQTYWYFTADDFISSFAFHHDDNLYFEPFDATLTLLLDYGRIKGEIGICNVVDQLIVLEYVNGYEFDPWSLFQFHVGYDVNDNLMLYLEYGRRMLTFGVETGGFTVELSSALDTLGFAASVGYSY